MFCWLLLTIIPVSSLVHRAANNCKQLPGPHIAADICLVLLPTAAVKASEVAVLVAMCFTNVLLLWSHL